MKCAKCGFVVSMYEGYIKPMNTHVRKGTYVVVAQCGCSILARIGDELFAKKNTVQMSVEFSQFEKNFWHEISRLKS